MSSASLHKQRVLKSIEHLLQSVEIELVSDIFVVHFAEEAVVVDRAEPLDPSAVGEV